MQFTISEYKEGFPSDMRPFNVNKTDIILQRPGKLLINIRSDDYESEFVDIQISKYTTFRLEEVLTDNINCYSADPDNKNTVIELLNQKNSTEKDAKKVEYDALEKVTVCYLQSDTDSYTLHDLASGIFQAYSYCESKRNVFQIQNIHYVDVQDSLFTGILTDA